MAKAKKLAGVPAHAQETEIVVTIRMISARKATKDEFDTYERR